MKISKMITDRYKLRIPPAVYYDLLADVRKLEEEQQPKIKVLERDEAMRKLGAVDIYQARAWITLLNDLEYLKLKICEVKE